MEHPEAPDRDKGLEQGVPIPAAVGAPTGPHIHLLEGGHCPGQLEQWGGRVGGLGLAVGHSACCRLYMILKGWLLLQQEAEGGGEAGEVAELGAGQPGPAKEDALVKTHSKTEFGFRYLYF